MFPEKYCLNKNYMDIFQTSVNKNSHLQYKHWTLVVEKTRISLISNLSQQLLLFTPSPG